MSVRALKAWRRRALVALAAIGASVAPAAAPVKDGWSADPDAQFLLDVNLHRMTLGDGVRAYQTPEGACLLFGDFLTTLDVPLRIDLGTGRAQGWAFNQKNTIAIDRNSGSATIKGKRESFATTTIRDTPDGWCVDQGALARWFGLAVKADVYNSLLLLDAKEKLPVELAIARRARGAEVARKRQAALGRSSLPRVTIPYRMWRTPALEFVVNAGVRYGVGSVQLRRDATVYAAGEMAALSYMASMGVSPNGMPRNVWARFYRSDPEARLLGPLRATHVAAGDVPGLTTTFNSSGGNGRGLVVTNRPLAQIGSFDRTEFRGRLPEGWDAELYRNGTLVAFDADSDENGEYLFQNIDILIGDNEYEIVLHGPQGQEQRIRETLNIGQDSAPPGTLWYWAGVREPGKDLLSLDKPRTTLIGATGPPVRRATGVEAIAQAQYGVDKRTSVSALVRSALAEDERVTYVEGAVRRSLGPSVVELAAMHGSNGESAARAQLLAKLGRTTLTASSLISSGAAGVDDDGRVLRSAHRVGLGVPLKLGDTRLPISASLGRTTFSDGAEALDGMVRLGTRIGRFDLASATTYERLDPAEGSREERVSTELIGTARVGAVRLRGSAEAEILPVKRLRALGLDAFWSKSDRVEWNAGVRYDSLAKVASAQVSHIRRFDSMAVTFTGEAQSNGAVAAGVRLSFSLDPSRSGLRPTRDRLATHGLVHARVFEDLNENGRFDSGEPVAKKAAITTGVKQSDALTDDRGLVTVGGLSPYVPLAVGIDQTSLDNPALAPSKPAQIVVPRPGVAAMLDIALVGGGTIEGFATKADGTPYEGLDFDLLDESGAVIATARSDLDGYIVYESIRYGRFAIRLNAGSASAIQAAPFAPVRVVISRDKPAARVGAIKVAALK